MRELSKIMKENQTGIAKLNLRENVLKETGMSILAQALAKNESIMQLDIS
jgi:hypothetical protein